MAADSDDQAVLARLQELEDSGDYEQPTRFDYHGSVARFETFVRALEADLGQPAELETGDKIQDATFHSDARFVLASGDAVLIRASNFGELVTIYEDEKVPEEMRARIVSLLQAHGFVYVPYRLLKLPCSDPTFPDWWGRFFDWL
jgi:hypothetical protein